MMSRDSARFPMTRHLIGDEGRFESERDVLLLSGWAI
jgi:hypothetical protein